MVSSLQAICLAAMLYSEGSIEPKTAQLELAYVAIRRAAIEKRTICSIVQEEGQFYTSPNIDHTSKIFSSYRKFAAEILKGQYTWLGSACSDALFFTHNDNPPKTIQPIELCGLVNTTRLWRIK
jgi:hypothetical protein